MLQLGSSSRFVVLVALCAFLLASNAPAQITSGTITGTVLDTTGAVVPQSQVTVTNEATGTARDLTTTETGVFIFAGLPPGSYSVKVDKTGFRPVTRTGLTLTANERLAIGNIELALGQTSEAVTVSASSIAINTEAADVASSLGTNQLNDLVIKGRDFMNLVKLLPGVSQTGGGDVAGGTFGIGSPAVGGMRATYNNMTLDGARGNDPGGPGFFSTGIAVDAIGEIKIITSSYLAETGPNPGVHIKLTTKSGTKDLHGTVYYYKRHQQFNAVDYFINRVPRKPNGDRSLQPFPYRLTTAGFTVGGPIYIPNVLNTDKSKLFFFWNTEITRTVLPGGQTFNTVGILQYTTPSALERNGDFSQTLDTNGTLIKVNDPTTKLQFANNVIPGNRINANGQRLISVFPAQNVFDRSLTGGTYNFQFRNFQDVPKQSNTIKVDYSPTTKDTISIRGKNWVSDSKSYTGIFSYNLTPLNYYDYYFTHQDVLVAWTRIISPNVVNEWSVAGTSSREVGEPRQDRTMTKVLRSNYGITLGQLFPNSNPFGIIPNMTFTGISNPVAFATDNRAPIQAHESFLEAADNLSVNRGNHALKFGFYFHTVFTNEGQRAPNFNGGLSFNKDGNNPGDANHPFATALLGNFQSYQEASRRNLNAMRIDIGEWYAQDQWKATKKLTLTYGARFSYANWFHQQAEEIGSALALSLYDRAKTPRQYLPAIVNGVRVAQDTVTGATLPYYGIGAFIPGSGEPANGVVTNADTLTGKYPIGYTDHQPVHFAPRFGFAYDVFGNGKTALRGGFGVGKNMIFGANERGNQFGFNQPYVVVSQQFNGNIDNLLSTKGLVFPSSMGAVDRGEKVPRVYNWSLGIQQTLPAKLALDVSYVGNTNRWVQNAMDINALPAGWRFDPKNIDSTNGVALPDNLLRPYREYTTVTYLNNTATSNYHSLQVQLNRRYGSLALSGAYTFSRAYGTEQGTCNVPAGAAGCIQNPYVPTAVWLRGLQNFQQDHVMVANFQWKLPGASRFASNPGAKTMVKAGFDNWELSGIYTYASGFPFSITATSSAFGDLSGSNILARPDVVKGVDADAGPKLPPDYGGLGNAPGGWFNRAAIAVPARGTFGTSGPNNFTGPPINNWDMTMMKNIPLGKNEARSLRIRIEAYNLFNHTQFLTLNATARFDGAGNQINNQLGWPIAARAPRVVQLGATLYF